MQDISDKELDHFFKKSIEHPEIPFEEDAWTKMEQSLIKHDQKQRLKSYTNHALLVVAVYILSAVSVRTIEQATPPKSFSFNAAEKTKPSSTSASLSNLPEDKNTTLTPKANIPAPKTNLIVMHSSTQQSSDQRMGLQRDKNGNTLSHLSANDDNASDPTMVRRERERERERNKNKQREISYSDQSIHAGKHNKGEASVVADVQQEHHHSASSETMSETPKTSDSEITTISSVTLLPDPIVLVVTDHETQPTTLNPTEELKNVSNTDHSMHTENSKNTNTVENTEQTDALTLLTDSTQKMITIDSLLPVVSTTTKDSTLPKDKAARKRHFSVGIFASPDFSFTASKDFVSPGLSEGFFVEYHYSKRFSLFAGLMHSSKIYSSSASDYKATDKYWGYKGSTSRIDGSCAVLDVPINVKYHFYNKDKNLLFATAGLSSYFMLHEQYSFIYKDGSPERSWEHTKKQNYFFGIMNLSLGYERYISKSFSLQVEPFIKIPLNNIGLGEVKLLTTGMFVYLKYSIK